MMMDLAAIPVACEGCFQGYPAVLSVILIVVLLIGSIYLLLASNLGARVGYLVTMVSLFAWMIILSLLWVIGAPGTVTATGPRGREAAWVPFTQTSEVARIDFPAAVSAFPNDGWDEPGEEYPGRISSSGELETVRTAIINALANEARVQETGPTRPQDWTFRRPGPALTEAEEQIPEATIRFRQEGNALLFGVTIPATDLHREITVFAFRDKGLVYLYGLYFLVISVIGFIFHLWLLSRHERKQKAMEKQLEGATVTVG